MGQQLVAALLCVGAEVHAIANTHAEHLLKLLPPEHVYSIGDDFLAIAGLVESVGPDTIFHLAAVHAEPPTFDEMTAMMNCSLRLGVALLHGAAACKRRPVFVHAGSYWQFDDGVHAPNTFYAAAKEALQSFLVYYQRAHNLPSVTLVLYDIFGPNDTRPKLWHKLLHAEPGARFPVSEGRQLIETVHVADIAAALLQAARLMLQGEELEPFLAVRSGVRITLRELLEQVQQRTGLDVVFEWGAIPYWPGQIFEPWQGPILPGWKPAVSPVDGLSELLLNGGSRA